MVDLDAFLCLLSNLNSASQSLLHVYLFIFIVASYGSSYRDTVRDS